MTSVGVRGADAAVVACQKKVPVCVYYSKSFFLLFLQIIQVLEFGEHRDVKLIGVRPINQLHELNKLIHRDNEAASHLNLFWGRLTQ